MQVGAGQKTITLHGYGNMVSVGAGAAATIHGGDGADQIALTDGTALIDLHGWGNVVSTEAASATITDGLGSSTFRVGPTGNEVLQAFAAAQASVVDLLGGAGGFADAAAAYAAVHDDAQGNARLDLGGAGSVLFQGVHTSQLSVGNFLIG